MKRHPTLRDRVTVGAGAKVIGAVEIGENVRIGAGSVVVTNVPPNATVVGVPGHIVAFHDDSNGAIQRLPDPEWERLNDLDRRMDELRRQIAHLEEHLARLHEQHHDGQPAPGPAGERSRWADGGAGAEAGGACRRRMPVSGRGLLTVEPHAIRKRLERLAKRQTPRPPGPQRAETRPSGPAARMAGMDLSQYPLEALADRVGTPFYFYDATRSWTGSSPNWPR
ncbi:hypothetical protein [Tepidiforma flava]|uniref:hypothetical protein n=1 Tax=Tepidiforma flava TaxID=3004094 RepID=UPI003570C334